jgi:hypothetical protein
LSCTWAFSAFKDWACASDADAAKIGTESHAARNELLMDAS